MSKILSIVIGIIVAVIGLILLYWWFYEFKFLLKAILPAFLIFAGVISLIAGLSELIDTAKLEEKK